ncbi:Protease HtpX [uncultured archaeon]|nr:Protease HtpX [uncultured archaeon]
MEKQRINFDDQISRNKWKSVLLMFSVFVVIVLLGYVISYAFDPGYFFVIMICATMFSLLYLMISYYNSDKIAIASVGAKEIKREGQYKQYYDLVEGLTIASGLPMPRLYVMNSNQINAFASGRDPHHSVVCVTEGALEKLDKKELEGVLAHELGHVASFDIRYMTLVAVMVGMISIISQMFLRSLWFGAGNDDRKNSSAAIFMIIGIVLAILAPLVVSFVQLAISRKREFSADASSVKFTRYPPGLIGALKKIKQENQRPDKKINKAVAPLFFANPFTELGSTHPPIDKRIAVLEKM